MEEVKTKQLMQSSSRGTLSRKPQYSDQIIDSFLELTKKGIHNNSRPNLNDQQQSQNLIPTPSKPIKYQPTYKSAYLSPQIKSYTNNNPFISPNQKISNYQLSQKNHKDYNHLRTTYDGYRYKNQFLKQPKKDSTLRQTQNAQTRTVPNFITKNKSKNAINDSTESDKNNPTKQSQMKNIQNQNSPLIKMKKNKVPTIVISKCESKGSEQLIDWKQCHSKLRGSFNKKESQLIKQLDTQEIKSDRYKFSKLPTYSNKNQSQTPSFKVKSKIEIPTYGHIRYKSTSCQNQLNQTNIVQSLQLTSFELGLCKGQGKIGKVYPARHKKTGFLCSIKTIKKKTVKPNLQHFIYQLKLHTLIDNPFIVQIYGIFHDHENFYVITELMEEGSLFSYLKLMKTLEQHQLATKIRDISLGLQALHQSDIIHRDIKPQNILLSNGTCKIYDFQRAVACSDRRSTLCGSKAYICPELLQGSTYDNSIDIWCLGVIGYEMMTGKTPFYNFSRKGTIKKITQCDLQFPSKVSADGRRFIVNALKKDPGDRIRIDTILKDKFLNVKKQEYVIDLI